MYEGLTSRMALKPSIPPSIVDEEDKKLLVSERVTDYDAFSYYFKISSRDHYLLIFKFIEVSYFGMSGDPQVKRRASIQYQDRRRSDTQS